MKNFLLLLMLLACSAGNVHVFAQQRAPEPDPEKENLIRLSEFFHQRYLERRAELERIANENNWPIRSVVDNVESELKYVDENGFPHYDVTNNLNAARTTNTNHLWTGGTSGLNLMGNNYLIGIWDGGRVRNTHQEFGSRVVLKDGTTFSNHGTHVGGTMIAAGVINAAHGMAPQALLHSYDWDDDLGEMTDEAAAGLTLSNHSYGRVRGWAWGNWSGNTNWHWLGDISISTTEDYLFGFYDELTQSWDQTAHAAPHYLIVKSAGNDRNENHTGGHYVVSGGSWVWSTASRDPDGGADGYDCISQRGVAKNILTIGAVHDIPGGWTQPSDVVMTDFSGWGPTDDGRIKPDIVANGMDLYSTGSSSNTHYYTIPGTSMSTPNVTGTLALLQEHFRNGRGGTMNAAALKGLALNTANEAGPNDGPDYMFGWGLLNATGAAELITNDADEGGLIVQGLLVGGQIKNYTYYSDGSPIRVTLCWTDPAGTPPAASLNPTTRMLVNDLDLRVIRQSPATTYSPWRLNLSNPAAAATKGDNIRDNVERVDINNPTPGYYTIRVSHKGSLSGGQQAYALIVNGLSTPPTLSYCEARTTASHIYEQITRVQMGSLDNRSQRSPGGYSNYTGLVTEMAKGASQTITVTFSGGEPETNGRIWVDWNQNGVFDTGELFALGSGSGPTYTTTITAPANALGGYTTMRIRVVYGTLPGPCSTHTWGETEDYAIKVGTPGLWAGTVSTDWFNPLNWDDGFLPTTATNVSIPAGTPFSPAVFSGNANCNSLTIFGGAVLNIYNKTLTINGNLTVSGTIGMLQNDGVINVLGNTVWNSGSSLNVTASLTFINAYGNWTFYGGAAVNPAMGFVDFRGSSDNWIRCYSTNSSFYNLRVYKTGGAAAKFSNLSSTDLVVNNLTFISSTSQFNSYSNFDIVMKGNFNYYGTYDFTMSSNTGSVIFDGNTQSINKFSSGSGIFNNVVFRSATGTTIGNGDITIAGNLTIEQGYFSPGNNTVFIAGDWTNLNFPAGFLRGDSRVVFNGSHHQYILPHEHFNILEANMGAALRVNGAAHTVTCEVYDWTSGGIDVLLGTFTALDLAQEGIYGGYWLNPGGTINITNSTSSQWVDLNGAIHIFGGTMNVTGIVCDFAFNGNAHIEMSGGVLDFKTCGIGIPNTTHALTTNITGGVIRTAHGFHSSRATFTPTAGTFEFYGSGNYFISQTAGSLYHVNINKGASRDGEVEPGKPLYDARSGKLLSDGGRSGAISLGSNFLITNNLNIESGTLNIEAHELTVARYAFIDGTLSMTNASGIFNAGTFSLDWLEFRNGSVANITHGTINCYGWIIPRGGSSFNLGLDNALFIKGQPSGGLSNFEPTATYGNVVIAKNAGALAVIDGSATEPIIINGDFTVSEDNIFRTQFNRMTVHGAFTDASSSVIQVLMAPAKGAEVYTSSSKEPVEIKPGRTDHYLEIDSEFDLKGQLFINNNGNVYVHGRFSSSPGSSININNGSFISDAPNHPDKGWQYLNGNLTMNNGLFEITNNSVNFGSTATTSVSGGIIRTGGAFYATHAGVFQPSGGVVEIIGSHPDALVYCYNGNYFHNLLVNRTGLYSRFMSSTVIQNDFTINQGEMRTGFNEISVYGNVNINDDGKLIFASNASILLGNNKALSINNGGLLDMTGTIANQPKISRISSGHYAFNVESGGTIAAEYGLFEYMDGNGINIKPGAIVDHTKAFHNCTFRLGQSGGRLMTINNSQTFAVNYASFPTNTWGGNFNVSKTVNAGVVTFMGYGGDFSGATYEQDPNSRIHWGGQTATNVTLQGVEIVPGQDICFEATNTLTIGGGGSIFELHNGGFVELVAGQNIRMLEGTHFHNGSYGWARITTTGDYCSLPAPLVAANEETLTSVEEAIENESGELFFKVYPNPTTGMFNLEIPDAAATVIVEIYSMMGGQLLKKEVSGFMRYEFDLSAQPRGLYIIRVYDGEKMGTQRIIRQ
jgi:hypothetical protein